MNSLIEVNQVSVKFGSFTALEQVSCELANTSQAIVGLIGPNGSGKTTLIHAILGLQTVTRGKVTVAKNVRTAYCPDTPEFEPYFTAPEVLAQSLRLAGNLPLVETEITELLETVGLSKAKHTRVGGYSRGMKQRLGIAAALILKPHVLFLDEPTSALDPLGRKAILQLIIKISRTTHVVISSHLLEDIQKIAGELWVLDKGRLAYSGGTQDLLNRFGKVGKVRVTDPKYLPSVLSTLAEIPEVVVNKNFVDTINFPEKYFSKVWSMLTPQAEQIAECTREEIDLYAAFEQLVNNSRISK